MNRTINLNVSDNQLIQIATSIKNWEELWKAIGYLATWHGDYDLTSINYDHKNNLIAHYENLENKRSYVIGAVWHGEHYGFHS